MENEPDLKAVRNLSAWDSKSEISYRPRESGTWVKVGEDREMPAEFVVSFWPRKDVDEPAAELHFAVIDGVPQCRGVIVSAIKGKRELRASDLRAIPVEDVLESVAAQLAVKITEDGHVVSRPLVPEWRREGVATVRRTRRDARRKVTDDTLREVAEIYRASIDRNPTDAVRAHLGVADRTARLYVRRARNAGFLGAAVPGRAGER